ncbi:5-formyltetrahydrofolate cyclo-ligase [Scatolibacter rhodanostii]|uniref:5-formyltetrahydrofolate cyclo-ligase n=1 Tax=Scatolibacter rhodanostii TaxID=2014781 RepID=UPI000C069459|nr:5-formyltetrahydrofolate cyclo-ligase [Scatolibacter rhodanostii]
MSVSEQKVELRKILRAKRKNIEFKLEKDRAIAKAFTELPAYQNAEQIFLYMSKQEEVDTEWIWNCAMKDGKEVLSPYCPPNSAEMQFYLVTDKSKLVKSEFGVLEPNPAQAEQKPVKETSICIVPGLSFTEEGFRLGYGKGYYDRFLALHKIFSIGFCYDELLSDSLPVNTFDQRVNMVLTDKKVMTVKGL